MRCRFEWVTIVTDQDKVDILLVDDQPAKLLSYEAILEQLGENLIKAGSATEALEQLLKRNVAVILIDVCMPDLDGFQLATMIREHPRFQKTAIIFVSAIQVTDVDLLRGYQLGAVDYVPVPVVPELLRAKVKVFAELYRKTRQLERLNAELEIRVTERTAELRLLEGVDTFCASVRGAMEEPSFTVQQKVLQLVVNRIVVEDNRVIIEHVVPTGPVRLQTEQQAPDKGTCCITFQKRLEPQRGGLSQRGVDDAHFPRAG